MPGFKKVGKVDQLLVHLLVNRGATEDETVGIMMTLQSPQEQWALAKWMASNREATLQDIIRKTLDFRVKKN